MTSESVWTDICSCNICIYYIPVGHGKGAWRDNVFVERLWRSIKYEEIYLNAYDSVTEAKSGIKAWINFYNEERKHQILGTTPSLMYDNLSGQLAA
jgi:hypothetical protein